MDSLLSDFDSHSESSSSEDQEDMESLYGGQARTIFSSLEETIEKIDDFLMFERGFLHGDIVCLVSDSLGQMGKVVNLDMTVDVENIYGSKFRNVGARYLQKIRSVSVGDCVACGPWLGKVERIVDCVTILFDDGTKCRLSTDGPERIIATTTDLIEDPQYPYYPGLRVRVESSATKSSHWFCGTGRYKHEQGTVCNVDAGVVYVDWLSCVASGEENKPPPCVQHLNNLSVLPFYPYANWQLGDWCVLPVESSFSHSYSRDTSPNFQQIAVIVKTKTKIDVQWQDGSQSLGIDSHLLFPVNIVDTHEFWPDSFVLEKGTVEDSQDPGSQRWGIVRSVDSKERTVKVKWCKLSPGPLDREEDEREEVVSAYELVEHPEYAYDLGGLVFRPHKSTIDFMDGNRVNHTISKVYTGEEADLKAVENSGDQTLNLNNIFLSCFGTVVGFKQGCVEVKWSSGAVSKVAPYEIYMVDKCESTTASVLGDENMQQTPEEHPVKNQLLGQRIKDVLGLNYDSEKESSSNSISQVAIGVLTSMTSGLFGSLGTSLFSGYRCTSEDVQVHGSPREDEALEPCNLNRDDQLVVEDDVQMPEKITLIHSNEDTMLPSGVKHPESFRQFDMVNDYSGHHFVNESGMDIQSPQVKRGWLKKVHQEWSILEKDLPETIYVRVYEERLQLLRAAIVGTAGTPYHDGLFFFDIYLPPQYPNEPPMVYYNSGGLRINPNLYESGKVCLSLLNTWSGSQSEVWNPGSSTILQVLLSLQALVLNEKPYFNEAGYDSQIGKPEGEKNSFSYNENAFLGSCRSMIYLLRKPPKHFEALVDEHFRRRCRSILLACRAYMEGAHIGHPFNPRKAEDEIEKGSSTGFKIMLAKLYSRLVEAFSDKGIDCGDFLDLQVPYNEPM
ncbi:hypothetical protein ACS0TY_018030 [Phlomoides rotata]